MATHIADGVSNVIDTAHPMWHFPDFDPFSWHTFFSDFIGEQAGFPIAASGLAAASAGTPWVITVTEAGAGDAASAIVDASGGQFKFTCDAADNDNIFIQSRSECFKWITGKRMVFMVRAKVSDATQSDLVLGLQIRDTTMLDVSDGIFFEKADGSATVNFSIEKNNTATQTAAGTLADDTFTYFGFVYDPGEAAFKVYFGTTPTLVATVTTLTNLVDDEELAISFGIQNGEAVAKVLTFDTIFVAQER